MSLLSTLALLLVQIGAPTALPAGPAPQDAAPSAGDSPLPVPEGLRCEYFVIEPATDSGDGPDGLVQISVTPSPHGPIREREVRFREGPIHLREVETHGPGRPQAIWREAGPTWGRSWLAIWDQGLGALETTHWGPSKEIHGSIALPERPLMGLELLELCRERWFDGEGFECMDALAGQVIQLEVSMRHLPPEEVELLLDRLGVRRIERRHRPVPATAFGPVEYAGDGGAARMVEWHRCDGTLAGRFLFRESQLLGFQWQEGSCWAQRVDQRTFDEARASWFPAVPDRTDILEVHLERLRLRSLQGVDSGALKASARIK